MKTLAFCMGLFITAFGIVGIIMPSGTAWIAQHSITAGVFYVVATVRVAFGLVLISVAPVSRAPKALRAIGYVVLVAGITTALTGLLAIERARAIVEWWLQQGPGLGRLTGAVLVAFGGFIAYACAPMRRGA